MAGLALGGGFARAMAHIGVLEVLEERGIEIEAIAGVSAGAMVGAAYASGTPLEEISALARNMRFWDVAGLAFSKMGVVSSERMNSFLRKIMRVERFEQMKIPLAVVATDLRTGEPAVFRGSGDVLLPIRASCAYPGLFRPVEQAGRLLVDGGMCMDVPSAAVRGLGAQRVLAVSLGALAVAEDPRNAWNVVNRCFQILQRRTEQEWRALSDWVIEPEVGEFGWDAFRGADAMIAVGRRAAERLVGGFG